MDHRALRALWLVSILLFSLIVAVSAGVLRHLAGDTAADVVTTAGAVFAATAALSLGMFEFLSRSS
jgi:hypothetical protein